MDQFPRRLSDGGKDSGGQSQRGDWGGMGGGTQRGTADYLVVPGQPWLDGFYVEKGLIRQLVAMPLGEGYTPEEQLTGEAEHGGLQIAVYPMKTSIYEERLRQRLERLEDGEIGPRRAPDDMGLAPAASCARRYIGTNTASVRGIRRFTPAASCISSTAFSSSI